LQAGLFGKLPIDKNDGDPFNACLLTLFDISGNQFLYGWVLHLLVKTLHIKLELRGNLLNLGIVQCLVVLKQLVVKLPELSLRMGCQGRNGSLMSEWVDGRKGEILKDQLDFFGMLVQHLLEQRLEPRTVWSLIVAKHGNDNRRTLGTLKWKSGGIKLIHFFELNDLYRIT
jgi:hypothetical protein